MSLIISVVLVSVSCTLLYPSARTCFRGTFTSAQIIVVTHVCAADLPMGFQCKLTNVSNAISSAPLHNWRACNGTDTYLSLADGSYSWSVRATGALMSCVCTLTFVNGIPFLWLILSNDVDCRFAQRTAQRTLKLPARTLEWSIWGTVRENLYVLYTNFIWAMQHSQCSVTHNLCALTAQAMPFPSTGSL